MNCDWDSTVCNNNNTAKNDHFAVLRWLHNNGHFKVLKRMSTNECQFNSNTHNFVTKNKIAQC